MNQYAINGYHIRLFRQPQEHRQAEQEVIAAGFPLPLAHRWIYAEASAEGRAWFATIHNEAGEIRGGWSMAFNPSRALPGHLLLRVERFGDSIAPDAIEPAIEALRQLSHCEPRVLRLNVEEFSRNENTRQLVEAALIRHGFQTISQTRRYRRTLALDLAGDEADIFANFSGSARKNVRAIKKFPVEIRPIVDVVHVPRMEELLREALSRTDGHYRSPGLAGRIKMSRENPTLAAFFGLFRTDMQTPEALLAFASSYFNGAYAHYEHAASTRNSGLKNLALNYALMWELICWAKRNGAGWFDFGGVTPGHTDSESDRLGGISDFKRYFCTHEIEVGGEWAIEPRWLRARIAKGVGAAARWVSSLKSKPL